MEQVSSQTKTRVQRGRKRASYDLQTAFDIIDDSLMCHVAQVRNEHPIVTPTCHWRDGDKLFWHGHAKAFNVIGSEGANVCINVSLLDGLVLARSAFHHSVNYRSVTVFGRPNLVTDEEQKVYQLEKFVEKISPGRWPTLRPINKKELMITSVVWISLDEFSVKMRSEGVNDDEADLDWPVWAGVLPVKQVLLPVKSEGSDSYSVPEHPSAFNHIPFGNK